MTTARRWSIIATAGLLLLAGCTAEPSAPTTPPAPSAPRFQLVAFDSCAELLTDLKKAAQKAVGPWGFDGHPPGRGWLKGDGPVAARGDSAAGAGQPAAEPLAEQPAPPHSGTNTHEAGVDEPDLVKTDGRRIITMSYGRLTVVDAATRAVTGSVRILKREDPAFLDDAQLLLHGDHVLVLVPAAVSYADAVPRADGRFVAPEPRPDELTGPRLILVDLRTGPTVLGSFQIDGNLVDARQVGSTARVVVRSTPHIEFPYPQGEDRRTDRQRVDDNRDAIERSTIDSWLPRYETSVGGTVEKGQLDCGRVSRPAVYTGTSLLTVLSFDLGDPSLGDGDPSGLVADGGTVYSNGPSLYVATDQRWRFMTWDFDRRTFKPADQTTDIYRFDTTQPGAPRFAGAGSVPGWLINQYALSEWDGHLRVATTSGQPWGDQAGSSSSVYVLEIGADALKEVGHLGGLGRTERIYSVRFAGDVGYVVTFRETDPLYTVDLSDPRSPRKLGELKIPGYSSYLHPIDEGRLLGIGQDVSSEGIGQGTQVSLFDTSDLADPGRLAQYFIKHGHSAAEHDPHAFFYWPAARTLVVPYEKYAEDGPAGSAAVVLRVSGTSFKEVGVLRHPNSRAGDVHLSSEVIRSLMVDGTLWTLSRSGLRATDPVSMERLAWLGF